MAHDVVLLLGVFAWLGKTLDGVFLAALLTVVGYSINDSVVVFDRIRELRRARAKDPMREVANDACLQTVPRTINTGLGALFILVALYVLGGETLTDFALALLIGIVVGTYSSVFTATPLAVWLEGLGAPPERAGRTPPSPRPAATEQEDEDEGDDAGTRLLVPTGRPAVRPPTATSGGASAAPRPRKKRRKPARPH
jgi:SecD/SecF fusion protein